MQSYIQRAESSSHLLGHSPNVHNSWVWVRLKQGVQKIHLGFLHGCRVPSTQAIVYCFPSQALAVKWTGRGKHLERELASMWDASATGRGLMCSVKTLPPLSKRQKIISNSVYHVNIILKPKPDKDSTRRLQTAILDECLAAYLNDCHHDRRDVS